MYRRIVARRIHAAWSALNRREYGRVLEQFATAFTHHFAGDHALGGTRHGREAQERWFQRLFRLLPDIQFSVQDVLVRGWPWETRAVAFVAVSAANGTYGNEVTQVIDIRWGRIDRIPNLEDTQRLARFLKALARGVADAGAPRIDEGSGRVEGARAA